MTTAEKIAALETEVAEITLALSHIRKGGQSYEITSGLASGTKRVVTMADYKVLSADRDRLNAEIAGLRGTRSVRITGGW